MCVRSNSCALLGLSSKALLDLTPTNESEVSVDSSTQSDLLTLVSTHRVHKLNTDFIAANSEHLTT